MSLGYSRLLKIFARAQTCANEQTPLLRVASGGQFEDCDNPPRGRLAANLTVFGAFIALSCSFGQMNAFGTFQSWYATHQLRHLHPSTISWIGSVQLWVFFSSGCLIGRLFDAYGPRPIMALGTALYVSSIVLTSMAKEFYQYILFHGVMFGLGVGMLFFPSLASISTHFTKSRASALGIAMVGSGIGGTLYPILLESLFSRLGYVPALRLSALFCLVLCSLATATVTSRAPRTDNLKAPDAAPRSAQAPCTAFFRALRDRQFALLVIGSCFVSLGLFIPFCYIVSYAADHAVPPARAFYTLATMNACSVVGRAAAARYADAAGRFALLVPCAFLAGLSSLAVWSTAGGSAARLAAYAVLYGAFSGAFNALIVPCIAEISDVEEIGARIGLLYTCISFPSLVGSPAAGVLLRYGRGSYTGMIVLSGVSVIVGSFFMLLVKIRMERARAECSAELPKGYTFSFRSQ